VLSQVQSVQQSISGVNLDEQAADLVSYQQAYQASAQVIASAQDLFQSLITALQATRNPMRISTNEFLLGSLNEHSGAGSKTSTSSTARSPAARPCSTPAAIRRRGPGRRPRQPGRQLTYDTANGQAATQTLQSGVSALTAGDDPAGPAAPDVTSIANGTSTEGPPIG
jgi:hypothetical protein